MPKNQLLDLLFKLFAERVTWPLKRLREKTQQPETLGEIAFLHRSAEHNGTWELKENFKEGVRAYVVFALTGQVTEYHRQNQNPGPVGYQG